MKRKISIVLTMVLLCTMLSGTMILHAEEINNDNLADDYNVSDEAATEVLLDDNSDEIVEKRDFTDAEQSIRLEKEPSISTTRETGSENTDLNNAMIIQTNSLSNDAITEEGQQRWYLFASAAGKLTLDLNFSNSTDVDYDIYLYQYDDTTGNINLVTGAATTSNIEHFAYMVDEGIYFVLVNGYAGYDAVNQYTLGVVLSTYYDSQEVDDTLQTAYNLSSTEFSVTGTVDNMFDKDIQKLVVNNDGRLNISLKNNGSTSNIYAADILNANGVRVATINQNANYYADLPQGTYYLRVYCSTFGGDYTSTYTLKGDVRRKASRVVITHAGDASAPITDYIDGPYWRVYSTSYVEGTAYDANGYLMPNADVTISVVVTLNDAVKTVSGKTDSQGKFKIQLNLGPGVGTYNYYNSGLSIHYYDIVPVTFLSNGSTMRSDISYFYHFAYQIML